MTSNRRSSLVGSGQKSFSSFFHFLQRMRLRYEGMRAKRDSKKKIVSVACWNFPIYSQNFVYQEVSQLIHQGYDVRFFYFRYDQSVVLPGQFHVLEQSRRKVSSFNGLDDLNYFKKQQPEKIESLITILCQESGLSRNELLSFENFLHAFTFARLVECFGPHYLHSYFFYEGALCTFIAAYLLDLPRGVSCYADHLLEDYPVKVVKLHLQQSQIVIATSARIKEELLSVAPEINAQKIIVKPNAINCDAFPMVNLDRTEGKSKFCLVSVCRIEPKKGLTYLIEAVRILIDQNYEVALHILGGVDKNPDVQMYAEKLQTQIKQLYLNDAVFLEGKKTEAEIKRFFRQSDVFVAPFVETETGDKDGIPTSILEAMASGLPVVATNAGSISEIIDEGINGIIVPQQDPQSLASAIADLHDNKVKRIDLGINANKKVLAQFDVKECEHIFHRSLSNVLNAQ